MNSTIEIDPQKKINQDFIDSANRFGIKALNKLKLNNKFCESIKTYLSDNGVELPKFKSIYKKNISEIYQFDEYGEEMKDKFEPLALTYYSLGNSKMIGGVFVDKEARYNTNYKKCIVPISFWYSRNKLDYLWNWRKSRIIRKKYKEYLTNATDEHNNKLIEYYRPIHLVLTVPHKNGNFRGKRFFAKELISCFTALRKTPTWSKYIYAGEYGLEVKRANNQTNGLHIHLHSFLLQNPDYPVNEARAAIDAAWRKITSNDSGYSGIHYETLFNYARDEKRQFIYEKKKIWTGKGYVEKLEIKKNYIVPGKSTIDEYLAGVMECIKYHFKPDAIERIDGEYDFYLITEVLNNTKNLRMYSRFGKFYREKDLNFNNLDNNRGIDENAETDIEDTENVMANVDGMEEKIINPFTLKKAEKGEYRIVIADPNILKLDNIREGGLGTSEKFLDANNFDLIHAPRDLPLKQVIRDYATGAFRSWFDTHDS